MYKVTSILLLAFLATLSGCQRQDEIREYTVDQPNRQSLRMLAAILPYKDKTWFFKISGPASDVGEQKPAFDAFIGSLHLDAKQEPPVTWKVPQGWKSQPGKGLRFASFVTEGPRPLEITVVPLGQDAGSELDNVNRWRKELGLLPVDHDRLAGMLTRKEIGGHEIVLVDMAGAVDHIPQKAKVSASPELGQLSSSLPFTFAVPQGWRKQLTPAPFSKASFTVGETEDVLVTLSPLIGDGGGLVANVNRWREKVGLPPSSATEIATQVQKFKISGQEAHIVDLSSPDKHGAVRILGVIFPREHETWFVKMSGSYTAVDEHKRDFENFVKSFRLDRK